MRVRLMQQSKKDFSINHNLKEPKRDLDRNKKSQFQFQFRYVIGSFKLKARNCFSYFRIAQGFCHSINRPNDQ